MMIPAAAVALLLAAAQGESILAAGAMLVIAGAAARLRGADCRAANRMWQRPREPTSATLPPPA
jgi:hypothetical protein